ncbi:Major facilitator superfamily domain, general substrate transporter [Penicillium expansum]|nr:Major facilitator superfamily domain, general substrate transporter [Penicillium expansum]
MYMLVGLGSGFHNAAWNVWIGNMANSHEVLGFFHGFYGVGATISPLVATSLIIKAGWQWYSYYYLMTGAAVISLIYSTGAFWAETGSKYQEENPSFPGRGGAFSQTRVALTYKVTWICAVFLFLYGGIEVAIGGWIVVFMTNVRHGDPFQSGMAETGFWLGITVGRFVLGFVSPRIGEKLSIAIYILLAIALELIFWLVPEFIVSAVAVAFVGFFMGTIFPGVVIVATRLLPKNLHVAAIGFAAAFSMGGGAVFPFMIGAIAQAKGVTVLQPILLAMLAVSLGIWAMVFRLPQHEIVFMIISNFDFDEVGINEGDRPSIAVNLRQVALINALWNIPPSRTPPNPQRSLTYLPKSAECVGLFLGYCRDLGRKPRYLDPEDMARATETPGPETKPADILNGDVPLPAGQAEAALDPESEEDIPVDAEELKEALGRPPPVNSSYLPLPWKGRLGYACLNTYLRYSTPSVFCSRTCRIASILENRHPLQDPDQPTHPIKNRPDRDQPADVARGQAFVEGLALANARDLVKIIRWNDKYGIKFMRLSSEMFPFASHKEYGYKLAPFASEVLADVGRVVAELGHRVSVHPGQFTQFGSPRKEVIENSVRDLEYHSEMLQLLKLPPQQDRDAVMILHMGGVFGDKAATLDRFRENYAMLSQDIKNRLVLENDDVSWSVHDLLPICEELNIPLVLDYHHHNIVFDANEVREGTEDIIPLYERISATWSRKNITQKMHYSEQTSPAITPRQRRKHSARVTTLPPCPPTMDLMIEAKDKEQAVFELMRNFKLPGYNLVNEIIPFMRLDENQPFKPPKKSKKNGGFVDLEGSIPPSRTIPDEEVGMGGPDGRVYWPECMEEWLRPAKKIVKPKATPSPKKGSSKKGKMKSAADDAPLDTPIKIETPVKKPARATKRTPPSSRSRKRKASLIESTPESEETENTEEISVELENAPASISLSRRSSRVKKVNYTEDIA